jgi:hypothetical protein
MPRHKTEARNRPAPAADYAALICQILKICQDNRLQRLPSIPLVKFLYMSECEYYQLYRRRLSKLGWFFYKYGPWASELKDDPALVESETKVISANHCIKYHKLDWLEAKLHGDYVEDLAVKSVVRRVVTPWALRYTEEEARWEYVTRELLNEVYFNTAPMRHARFEETLDFDLIPPIKPAVDLVVDKKWIAEVKLRFRRSAKAPTESTRDLYPLPELAPAVRDSVTRALEQVSYEEDGSLQGFVPLSTKTEDLQGAFGDE